MSNNSEGKIKVEAGKRYSWCNCGKSKKYPLCDGTHRELEGIQPVRTWFHEDLEVFFSRENGKLQLKLEKTGGKHENCLYFKILYDCPGDSLPYFLGGRLMNQD